MNWVGHMYYSGYGVEQDYKKGHDWLLKSAKLGNAASMHYVGTMYSSGRGAPRAYNTAMGWYIDAYVNGYEAALDSINLMLENDIGLKTYYERYGELIFAD